MNWYKLNHDHTYTKIEDFLEGARAFGEQDRIVSKTKIGEVEVSTVFLGLDHNFFSGPPLLFETMIFGGPLDQEQERYTTWDEAVEGHNRMVKRAQKEKENQK